jgi:hypothetical protein
MDDSVFPFVARRTYSRGGRIIMGFVSLLLVTVLSGREVTAQVPKLDGAPLLKNSQKGTGA